MKIKKGISLIILVITIIVMIVLATAIILTINNTNIIGKANRAVSETDKATEKEAVVLAVASSIKTDGTVDFTYLDANIPSTVTGTNGTYEGYVTYNVSTKGIITIDGEPIEESVIGVPGGYTVTFKSEGTTYNIQSVLSGQSIDKPLTNPTPTLPENENFSGWGVSVDSTIPVNFPYTPTQNTTLYALYNLTNEDMVLARNGAVICVIEGRAYTTATDNPVVCAYYYRQGYTEGFVISKNQADAKFVSGRYGANESGGSIEFNGETWYYSDLGAAIGGDCTSTATDMVLLQKLNATSPSTAAKELVERYYYCYVEE